MTPARTSRPVPGVSLKFLLDTNAFLALEPSLDTILRDVNLGARFTRLAQSAGHQLFLAQASLTDFTHDSDAQRRSLNIARAGKYQMLGEVKPSGTLAALFQDATGRTAVNDQIDLRLLAALDAKAVDFLVTDDRRLRRKAIRAGLGDWVFTLSEGCLYLEALEPKSVLPPPAVQQLSAYQLDPRDAIFASLRVDYPGFDTWFDGVRLNHRPAWIIQAESGSYAALMILKIESSDNEFVPDGKVLKVSTFKVEDESRGRNLGELLLKTLFTEAHAHGFDTIYVTVFEKHDRLIDLLEAFGFEKGERLTALGEHVMVKHMKPVGSTISEPLDYHKRFGPPCISPASRVFIVPIIPAWHDLLFPDWRQQERLAIGAGTTAYGNALRKAYVSKTNARQIGAGDCVAFYRSHDKRELTVVGVVEDVLISSDPAEIVAFVGRRTVYRPDQIVRMAASAGELHAMLFRQDRLLEPGFPWDALRQGGVLKVAPQSVTRVREKGTQWILNRLAA